MDQPPILTPEEVAAVLRVSRRTIGRLIADGRLAGFHIGGQLRISREALRAYLSSLSPA